ncbi:hypothetical protein [Phyllobacterium endophyticum]|jgi:hypothetical protein|uniref:hypothetical protein n=1 Tax=Phyllobacterium endophyticum TaxID=1149773 RepID=UPI0011C81178|nr:hypothetical protein [Phyllobacterium endophyticum]TXR47593.1 hypothetical protein FVA77_18845 [Phyllobacterium endophyticum]
MPRTSQFPKADTFNLRIDSDLKAAFTQATEAEDKPAAQVIRDFMRSYVERQRRKAFELEARRQSLAIARRSRNSSTDEYVSLLELEALFDETAVDDDSAK